MQSTSPITLSYLTGYVNRAISYIGLNSRVLKNIAVHQL